MVETRHCTFCFLLQQTYKARYPDTEYSCKYTEYAVAGNRQEAVLQHGDWAEDNTFLSQRARMLRNVTKYFKLGRI
jgi:hypothetical protein